jgi:ABC-2 type transport system permease protein
VITTGYRGGLALIRSTWASWMQYRSFFFVLAFGWMIPPLVSLFVWSAAAGEGSLAGFDRAGFSAYYLVLVLVNQLTYAQTNWTVGDVIRQGGLTPWLLRPIPTMYHALSTELAGKVVYMAFVIPVSLVLALLLRPRLDPSLRECACFLLALVLAWALRFFWGYWLALFAFWTTRAEALLSVQDALVFLLSGVIAPVALLPEGMLFLSNLLPFHSMVGFPVEILVRHLSSAEILSGLAVQAAWLLAAIALYRLFWVVGLKRYSAIGG